jgi:serpin B
VTFDLTFDRPFLFCIRDRRTDTVVFLGRVVDAGAAQ